MLIRSQDKKTLINLRNIESIDIIGYEVKGIISIQDEENANTWYIAYSGYEKMVFIGRYSTEAKAIKVLDMIADNYTNLTAYKANDPYRNGCDSVFQMPSDEEMEV